MSEAMDFVMENYVTEAELTKLLGVDHKRIRDLRSHHVKGKQKFINHIKPTSKCVLYDKQEVRGYLVDQKVHSFGISKTDPDK